MNTAFELKNGLIKRIQQINDLSFLQAIQTILDKTDQNYFPLTDEQKTSIEISRKQIAKGQFKGNDSVLSEIKQWLTKK